MCRATRPKPLRAHGLRGSWNGDLQDRLAADHRLVRLIGESLDPRTAILSSPLIAQVLDPDPFDSCHVPSALVRAKEIDGCFDRASSRLFLYQFIRHSSTDCRLGLD